MSCSRIGAVGIYDPAHPRPPGLSFPDAARKGLLLTQHAPAAWESADYWKVHDNPGNLVWSLGAWRLLGEHSASTLDFRRARVLHRPNAFCQLYMATGPTFTASGSSQVYIKRAQHLLAAMHSVRKPMILLGAGVAGAIRCDESLSPWMTDFAGNLSRHIATHGGVVGLRGPCSHKMLSSAGFSSGFEDLGCPSLFLDTAPYMGARLQRRYRRLRDKIADKKPLKVCGSCRT